MDVAPSAGLSPKFPGRTPVMVANCTYIPLLPGQSWHVTPVGFLRTSRWVIEILDILPRLALGEVSIVFRKWALPHSMVSPLQGSVLSKNPVLQLYSGPLHAETWRLAIFPPGTTAHCIRLETVPRGRGVAEPSSLSNLPSRVRICADLRICPISSSEQHLHSL